MNRSPQHLDLAPDSGASPPRHAPLDPMLARIRASDLPPIGQELVELIGFPAFLVLVEELGGSRFPMPSDAETSIVRYDALVEIVGRDAAHLLIERYRGCSLDIPNCGLALQRARDRLMAADFDAHMPAGAIARKYRVSERTVWRALKRAD